MDQGRNHRYLFEADRIWEKAPEGLRYALFKTGDEAPDLPLSVLTDYPPGHTIAPHTHDSDYIEIVIAGMLWVGKTCFTSGDVRIMKAGGGYGPLVAGPEGCRVFTVFDRAAGSATRWLGRS